MQENGNSASGGRDPKGQKVLDEDGTVDAEAKKYILQSQQMVREKKTELFIDAPVDDTKTISASEQVVYYGFAVEQFIEAIQPLMTVGDVRGADEYWQRVELGSVTLYPQDTEGYQFSQYYNGPMNRGQFIRQHDLPRDVKLPEPVTKEFVGLKSIIEHDTSVSHQWAIDIGKFHGPANGGVLTPEHTRIVPRDIYDAAFHKANEFLQVIGISVNTGAPERPSRPDPI